MENNGQERENIQIVSLKTALEERYLSYALSTIMNRALPDVRDGLKPVHRRIIHAMRQLRLAPGRPMAKCARIVGEVMGKFHPHGDQSIYDALSRLAQDFIMRYPLIEGQGNFGNIDGDNPAAMRYTEARMTAVCLALLEGISEDSVDFKPTYNEEDEEPVVLPSAFPNLLANGSSGIAVGMATSIPPHNAYELCNAALQLIKNPDATVESLMSNTHTPDLAGNGMIQGPDFPTGGIIIESWETILKAYTTGKGNFRVRARWEVEDQGRGVYHIIVTEIPYGIQKSRLVEKIAELLLARKLPLLDDVRDESSETIRLVLVPKTRGVEASILMESLFKQTDLESRFLLNMNVLSHGKIPRVLSLKDILKEWLEHRCEVLVRRSRQRLSEIDRQLEVLAGHLIACVNIDEVIQIIREEDHPKPILIARWSLTELQAETILDLRLRQLRKLEEIEIKEKHENLIKEKRQVEALLAHEHIQWKVIQSEVERIRDTFGLKTDIGKRRTTFCLPPTHNDTDIQQGMVEKEPVTVIISEKGWMRTLKGHIQDISLLSFKEGDSLKIFLHTQSTDRLLFLTTHGKSYTIEVARLPGGRGHGEPIRIIIDLEKEDNILAAFVYDPSKKLLLISQDGYGFIISAPDLLGNTRKGKQIMNVRSPHPVASCIAVEGDYVAIVGKNQRLLLFSLTEIPVMSRGRGVRLQKYINTVVLDAQIFLMKDGLAWTNSQGKKIQKSEKELIEWQGKRGTAGRVLQKGFSHFK